MPILELGACAVHVPYHTTWMYEKTSHTIENKNFFEARTMLDVLQFLDKK
jgi:putative hydrolase of the HAD superfamily